MYIIGISGSPKREASQTRRLVQQVLDSAQAAGAETELVDLSTLNIKYCTACGVCYAKGACVHCDDFAPLLAKILKSDGLVFGSPLYFGSCTAQFKTMLDRMADTIHCQQFLGKYGCTVATAGSPDFCEVSDYLTGVLLRFGAYSVGSAGASVSIPGMMEHGLAEAQALGTTLVKAIQEKTSYPEQDQVHAAMLQRFKFLINMNKDIWSHEYAYWQDQGWL